MIKIHICLLLIMAPAIAMGQSTFDAFITVGVNAAQVNGDLLAGYNKLGVHAGLRVEADFSPQVVGSVELLYSQRGSRSNLFDSDPRQIDLRYVEIPILVGYRDWLDDDHYRLLFEGGISVGRLIDQDVTVLGIEDRVNEFQRTDIAYVLGTMYLPGTRVSYGFRYNNSLNFLLNRPDDPQFGRLRGYFLTFRLLYSL